MKKRLISWVFYQEGEFIWCYDEIICALCKINMKDFSLECIVSPIQLLENEEYEIGKLIGWRNKIILLPINIGKKWVIYNKQSGKIEYWFIVKEDHKSAEAILNGDELTIFPICPENPILVIDLLNKKCIKKIYFPKVNPIWKTDMQIWNVDIYLGNMHFLIRNSCYYGSLIDAELQLIPIHAEKALYCADFCGDTGWAVSRYGEYLYHFGKEGDILEKYQAEPGTEFIRLVAYENCIVLFPVDKSEIRVFCVDSREMRKIPYRQNYLSVELPEIMNVSGYYGHIKESSHLWVLPLKYPLLVINLDTLEYEQIHIEYTDEFSKKKYDEYANYVRKMKRFIFRENKSLGTLGRYIEMIKQYCTKFIDERKMEQQQGARKYEKESIYLRIRKEI